MSETSRERAEVSSLGINPDGQALQNMINKLMGVRNLKDLHLKHHLMSSAQNLRREQITWIFQERFMTFTSMW